MAPIPIIPLLAMALAVVGEVLSMPLNQISAVGAVFVVVPIVIIPVVAIVDSNLYDGALGFGGARHCDWSSKDSGQDQRSDVAMCAVHVYPRIRISDFKVAVGEYAAQRPPASVLFGTPCRAARGFSRGRAAPHTLRVRRFTQAPESGIMGVWLCECARQ